MEPIVVYLCAVGLLLVASIAVRIWRWTPTRKCHRCGAAVELGRSRCQVCQYRFQD